MDGMNGLQGMMPQKNNKTDTKELSKIMNKYYQEGMKKGKVLAYDSILLKIKTGATLEDITNLCEVIKELESEENV